MSTTTSSTAGPVTTTSTSTSGPPNPPTGLFSSDASPALILAFLAIGIFAGGLMCMVFLRRYGLLSFIWRRRMPPVVLHADVQEWAAGVAVTGGPSRRGRKPLGPKPKLWDIESGASLGDGLWSAITPLSARYHTISSPDEAQRASGVPAEEPRSPARRGLARWAHKAATESLPISSTVSRTSAQMDVAVVVAMPVPNRQRAVPEKIPIYELGLLAVPWDAEKASPQEPDSDVPRPS